MDSMYTVSSFLVAYTLHSVPIDFIASFAYGSLLFYGVGMSGSTSEFFIFVFIVFFIVFAGMTCEIGRKDRIIRFLLEMTC